MGQTVSRSKGSRNQLLQTTNPLIARPCLGVLTVPGNKLHMFWAQVFPSTQTINVAVGTTFIVFSYDTVWAEPITSPTPNGCPMCYTTVVGKKLEDTWKPIFEMWMVLCHFICFSTSSASTIIIQVWNNKFLYLFDYITTSRVFILILDYTAVLVGKVRKKPHTCCNKFITTCTNLKKIRIFKSFLW